MNIKWLATRLLVILGTALIGSARGGEASFNLPAMGGFAVSPDNTTLVVSLTAKTELVFYDTVAGKQTQRVEVEFQPTRVVWSDKVLFVAQKSSGLVHVLDAQSGKELAEGSVGGPIRNLSLGKGVCFASTDSRKIYAVDATGNVTQTQAKGSFIAMDPKGSTLYSVIDGLARTDLMKYTTDGVNLHSEGTLQGEVAASLPNVQGLQVSSDGTKVMVVAGGGWASVDQKRHYGIPVYGTADYALLGELETGAYPCGCAVHPYLPLIFACNGSEGSVCSAKSYAPKQKFTAPRRITGSAAPSVLAFVGQGRKLAWGVSSGDSGLLKFYDLELTHAQEADLIHAMNEK